MPHRDRSVRYPRGLVAAAAALSLAIAACEQKPERPAAASTEWQEFQGSWSANGIRRSISLGADRQSSIIDLRGTMLLTGPGRPGLGFRAHVIALADSETGLSGRSVWTDERGDQLFCELKGEGTKESNRIVGEFIGGTGRYGAVSGSYEFSWQFVIELEDGTVQGRAADLRGRYRMGQPDVKGATP